MLPSILKGDTGQVTEANSNVKGQARNTNMFRYCLFLLNKMQSIMSSTEYKH